MNNGAGGLLKKEGIKPSQYYQEYMYSNYSWYYYIG